MAQTAAYPSSPQQAHQPEKEAAQISECPRTTHDECCIKDTKIQRQLMSKCSEAIAACVECEEKVDECYKTCKQCNVMMMASMRCIAAMTPNVNEVLELSARLATHCANMCRKHESQVCKTCARKCEEWANEVTRVLRMGKKP